VAVPCGGARSVPQNLRKEKLCRKRQYFEPPLGVPGQTEDSLEAPRLKRAGALRTAVKAVADQLWHGDPHRAPPVGISCAHWLKLLGLIQRCSFRIIDQNGGACSSRRILGRSSQEFETFNPAVRTPDGFVLVAANGYLKTDFISGWRRGTV